ncbi:MAG: hypothetical protein EPN91_02725 [Salinibacterium sp.]|nr:MAG: hypothetical protein EPN91_02725 [Salinibacterium sp.]
MTRRSFRFERDYGLPRVIVWDALIDPDLVSGWLGEAEITPEIDGEYDLRAHPEDPSRKTLGRIVALRHLERLDVETSDLGLINFRLTELPGGSRGTSTRVQLAVEVELEDGADTIDADWERRLDQLGALLRGHPVDWANWEKA